MKQFDENELASLFHLCRIECAEEERETLFKNFASMVAYANLLQEVDTNGVKPSNQTTAGHKNILRDDEIGPLLPRDTFLANSPSHVGGMIRVPPVLKPS